MIKSCVEDIWDQYDEDNSGILDKAECREFIKKTLSEIMPGKEDQIYNEPDFERVFTDFDINNDGTISKEEMSRFIKKVAGL